MDSCLVSWPMLPIGPGRCMWLRGGCRSRTPPNMYSDLQRPCEKAAHGGRCTMTRLKPREFSCLLPCLITSRQTGWCPKTPVMAAAARSPPLSSSRRRQCAPRLASCLCRTGSGSREILAPITRRWGGFLQVLRQSWVHSEPTIRGRCRQAP